MPNSLYNGQNPVMEVNENIAATASSTNENGATTIFPTTKMTIATTTIERIKMSSADMFIFVFMIKNFLKNEK